MSNGDIPLPVMRPIYISDIDKPSEWMLMENYKLGDFPYTVPAGFIFNGASVPRALWSIVNPTGLLFIPALFHDYAYKNGYLLDDFYYLKNNIRMEIRFTRKKADELLREMGLYLYGNYWRARWRIYISYYALRVFGILIWRKYRREELDGKLG